MAKKVFAMYLAKEGNPNSDAYAKLDLPASPWELWDALEKVRLQTDDILYMEIEDYYAFEHLAPHLDGLEISLNELNDLAARLATLDEVQGIAFEGLFSMEVQKKVNTNGGIITMQDTRTRGEHLPRRANLPSKRMPQKPRQRTLRSRHLSRRHSPNLTVRRVPRQMIPPPLMMPHLRVPHRLRLKMHRLFLSSQFTPNSRKGAHRQERITMLPRWVKPSCGCCTT